MFTRIECKQPGCSKFQVASSPFCPEHHPDKPTLMADLKNHFAKEQVHSNGKYTGLTFVDFDFSGKQWICCDFSHSTFQGCSFENASFMLCFFEHTRIEDSIFDHHHSMESTMARSVIRNSRFHQSQSILTSYNGAIIQGCSFTGSDLMYSRFIETRLTNVELNDCNLKSTHFISTKFEQVNFSYSNREDALYEP